ncbi:DUF4345 family protein [Litorivivens sp.]|uniref:DUF4345 family protein n=1 Tax=Litorivivens sp. TaxID=2020868 RepID=UPI00356ADC49
MWVRILLFFLAIAWTPYGMYCLFFPEFLGPVAGLEAVRPEGVTELRAMYGGVQIAVGLSALLGFFRVVYLDKVLFVQLMVLGGLGSTRLLSAVFSSDWSVYTIGALVFEWVSFALCVAASRAQPAHL